MTEEQFEEFLQRHKHIPFLVAESNVKVVSTEIYSLMYTDLRTLIHHFKHHIDFDLQNSLAGSIINLSSKGVLLNGTKTAKRVGRKSTRLLSYQHICTEGLRDISLSNRDSANHLTIQNSHSDYMT